METECVITNKALKVGLTLVKQVTNDNGGTALPSAWDLTATRDSDGTTVINAQETGTTGASVTTDAGTFNLSESGGASGYAASAWVCNGTGTQNDATPSPSEPGRAPPAPSPTTTRPAPDRQEGRRQRQRRHR